jgi:predicted RNA-binding Zn-ribbon protein involved in translation (DUF1610 family)
VADKVTAEGAYLVFVFEHGGRRKRKTERGMLFDFLLLAGAENKEILEYARRWGPLGMCAAHGLPISHPRDAKVPLVGARTAMRKVGRAETGYCPPRTALDAPAGSVLTRAFHAQATLAPKGQDRIYEPIEWWRQFASGAGALLKLCHSLWNSDAEPAEPIRAEDWAHLFGPDDNRLDQIQHDLDQFHAQNGPPSSLQRLRKLVLAKPHCPDRPSARKEIVRRLNDWLDLIQIQPRCGPPPSPRGRIKMELQGGPPLCALFANLLMELAFAATGSKAVLTCSSCGYLYQPKQKPRGGVNRFCPTCGRAAALRFASAKYRNQRATA